MLRRPFAATQLMIIMIDGCWNAHRSNGHSPSDATWHPGTIADGSLFFKELTDMDSCATILLNDS